VRAMIEEARGLDFASGFRLGVTAGLRKVPAFKKAADFAFAQICFSTPDLLAWREANPLPIPVYAGVMVLASANMARRLAATIPDISIPQSLIDQVEQDPRAGVDFACAQIDEIRASGAFDGIHLVPVSRYREMALRLEN
jgi:5,10-methylenetetrahydrofolate reductase